MGKDLHPGAGFAIKTGKIAAIGYGDAKIVDAAVAVIKKLHEKNVPQALRDFKRKYHLDRILFYQYN
jgi:hypothetical protein